MSKKTKQSLDRLSDKLLFINTVHTALLSSIDINDIYKIILSSLVTKGAFNFGRAFLFLADKDKNIFRGKFAYGPIDVYEAEELEKREAEERDYIDKLSNKIHYLNKEKENIALFQTSMAKLKTAYQWLHSYQFEMDVSKLSNLIKDITIEIDESNKKNVFYQAYSKAHAIHFKNVTTPLMMNPRLIDIVNNKEFIIFPLKVRDQIMAIVIVDNKYTGGEFGDTTLEDLEWFTGETSLALENARLYSNLRGAFEQLKEIDDIKSNFLSMISHELRTPLTSIIGFSGILMNQKTGRLSKIQKKYLSKILTHSAHLETMFDEMLELIELEIHQEYEITLEPYPLKDLLDEVIDGMRMILESKQHDFIFTPPDENINVIVDKDKFRKSISYILNNSFKFTEETKGVIRIDVVKKETMADIYISDNGIGISEEKLERIFDKFYQVDSDLSRSYGGMGIGLTLASQYIAKMNGLISVESELNKGSKFCISVPVSLGKS